MNPRADTSDMTGPPKRGLSEAVEWQLLVIAFNQTPSLVLGGLGLAVAAIFAWLHTHQSWLLLWAFAALVVLVVRLVVDYTFRQATKDTLDFASGAIDLSLGRG